MSDLMENPELSTFVSYPPENVVPNSETTIGTETGPTNYDVTPAPANVTASNPATVPNLGTSTVPVRRNPPRSRKPLERLTY